MFSFSIILDLIKLCAHDFSRVTFATELSTYLVYKSIFVIDYYYIFIHLLFFFTVKMSIFSRLCVKHKRLSRSTHTEIVLVSDRYRYRQILSFWYRIGSEKVTSSQPYSEQQVERTYMLFINHDT